MCLVPAKVASERRIVALLENAMSQVAAIGDAKPVGFALASPIEQTTPEQECASCWSSDGWSHRLAPPVDHAAHCRCSALENGTEKGIGAHLALQGCDKVWRQKLPRGLRGIRLDRDLSRHQM